MRPTAIAALLLALGLPFRQASATTVDVYSDRSGLAIQVSTPSPYYLSPWGFGAGPGGDGTYGYGYGYAYPYDDWPNPYEPYVAECTPTWNGGIYCLPGGPPQYYFPPTYLVPPPGGFTFGFGFGPGPGVAPGMRPPRGGGHHGGGGHRGGGSFRGDTRGRPMP